MHLLWALLPLLSAAADLKVQYYYDGGCSDYAVEAHPGAGFSCYNYHYPGTNSANIAFTSYPNGQSVCYFYVNDDCTGAVDSVVYPKPNCASNYGHGFKSMKCGVIHDP